MNAPCLVIPRITHATLPVTGEWSVDLFLPSDPANPGMISCWDGCHCDATLGYYDETKPPRNDAERKAADEAVRRYQAFMNSTPAEDRQPITRIERLPRGWRVQSGARPRVL